MNDDAIIARVEKFERTVATCLSVVPVLFAAQCFFASIAAPEFKQMYADFGSKLPGLTNLVLRTWPMWTAISILIPMIAVLGSRKFRSRTSVMFSTIAGVVMFVAAQVVTLALFLPIFQLGAVASGSK